MDSTTKRTQTLIFAVIFSILLVGCGGKPGSDADGKSADGQGKENNEPDAVPVEVVTVNTQTISANYSGTANLEAPNEAQVVAKSSGVLVSQLAEEGDFVTQGQVMARIDPSRAMLEVQRSQAMVNKLTNNYNRAQKLLSQKLISAEANDQIRFDLESAKASLNLAKLELSNTNVIAPISGVVAQRMVKQGNLVTLNAPVYRIVNTQNLEAVINVPEREMALIIKDMPVRMMVDAIPGKVFEGVVDRISPVMDSGSGTFRVTSAFNSDKILRSGMFGRLEIAYDQRDNVLTIPRAALIEDEGESAVYIVRSGKAIRAPIKTGYSNGEIAEVISGIRQGDKVITAGKVAVRDGSKVSVIGIDGKAVNAPKKIEKKSGDN
ncbi:MAG: efflux RND transporter periplasmic adaptor subunit [Arenimonas sp.]|nr:efflux RND transporter periplasmic adaptor subunit [Arenimonas sp.]MBP6309057.1 efflux RND transporter periplasmic adaptor subunit [Arenimonas sp.]